VRHFSWEICGFLLALRVRLGFGTGETFQASTLCDWGLERERPFKQAHSPKVALPCSVIYDIRYTVVNTMQGQTPVADPDLPPRSGPAGL